MEEQEQNRRIAEFVEVSQSSPDEAQELLEASNWDVQVRNPNAPDGDIK